MSALTVEEAESLLAEEAEVGPCLEGPLRDVRSLRESCLQAGIPAAIGMEACDKPGCSPKAQLLVRAEDGQRVAALLRDQWVESVKALGVEVPAFPAAPEGEDGEPPCPACGTAAPLVEGACSDCGLQLE